MYEKTVRIILEAIDKVSKPLENVRRQFNKTQKDMQRQAKEFAPLADKTVYITKRMIDQGRKQIAVTERYEYAARKAQETLEHNRLAAGKLTRTIQETTRAHEGFKMHLLSVMFFGMSLQRMFGGYIDQVLKTTGVLDFLSATINLMLLPVLIPLLDIIYDIMSWFMNLDENTRKWIGSAMIATAVIGTLFMTIGMLGLGLQGLSRFFQEAIPLDFIDNISIAGFSVGELGSNIEELLGSWGIIIAGVSAFLALTLGIKKTSDAAEGNINIFEIFKETAVNVWNAIIDVVGGIIRWIASGFRGELIPSVSAGTDALEEFGVAPINPIKIFLDILDFAVKQIEKAVKKIVNIIGENLFGEKRWKKIKEAKKSGPVGVIVTFFAEVKNLFIQKCKETANVIGEIIFGREEWNRLRMSRESGVLGVIATFMDIIKNKVIEFSKKVLNAIGETIFGREKWNEIKEAKQHGIIAVIAALIDAICEKLLGPWWTNKLKPTIGSLYERIRDFIGGRIDEDFKNYLLYKLSSAIEYMSNLIPTAQDLGEGIVNSINNGIRNISVVPITLPHVEIPFSEGTPENLKKWGMFVVSKFSEGIQSVPQPRFKLGNVELPFATYLDWANAIRSNLQGAINAIGPVTIPTTAETPRITIPSGERRRREEEEYFHREPGPTEYPYESGPPPEEPERRRPTREEELREQYPGAPWIAHPKPYQRGGIVPRTMPILAHAGETVLPAGVSPVVYFSPVININATLGSDVDVRNLGNTLSEMWSIDLKRRLMR
ncbi:MAG: hypothetical protein DRO76_03500 [Candidatus Altiarchaeales archaeon]|nr:MAG: hypothetical protein DRO76_03500 [Candidatus Altiarchaeales archaeon]